MYALSFVFACVLPMVSALSNNTNKVILDNDWGTVEFSPFLMALDAGWDVLGLVSNTANSWSLQCGLHALATLEVGGLDQCIPVHKGADLPLLNTPQLHRQWEDAYGALPFQGAFDLQKGRGNQTESKNPVARDPAGEDPRQINRDAFFEGYPNQTFASHDGAMFMIEQVRKYPGQVSIYSAGSMTNIALAARMDLDFAKNAKELVLMGGYVDLSIDLASNDNTVADISSDINLKIDPEGAKIALTSPFPRITIVGNGANAVLPNATFYERLRSTPTPYSNILEKFLVSQNPIWDSVAAAVMLNPDVVTKYIDVYVDVNTARASPTYGSIYIFSEKLRPKASKLQKARMILDVDSNSVRDRILRAVTHTKTCEDLNRLRSGNK